MLSDIENLFFILESNDQVKNFCNFVDGYKDGVSDYYCKTQSNGSGSDYEKGLEYGYENAYKYAEDGSDNED